MLIEIPSLAHLNFNLEPVSNNLCSNCGEELVKTRSSCTGSGKNIYVVDSFVGDKYCYECGRTLQKEKKDNKCFNCNSSGKVKKIYCCPRT